MQNITITIVTPTGQISNIQFDPTNNLHQLRNAVAGQLKINKDSFTMLHNGKALTQNFMNMIQLKIANGDIVQVQQKVAPNIASSMQQAFQPQSRLRQEAEVLRSKYLNNQAELNMLLERDPEMAEAVLSEDVQDTVNFIVQRKRKIQADKMKKMQEEQKLMADPFDVNAQREIEKRIKLERMNKELEYAHENMPESFVRTTMLYIQMECNGKEFQAFVDSGAQSTIMSKSFAQRCGLLKDVDSRYQGMAVGVGTTKIVGRIHRCRLKVANHTIECAIQVLDNDDMQMLFGLDMLKKFRCCINLFDNVLEFKSQGFSVPFMKDHQINEGMIKSRVFKAEIAQEIKEEGAMEEEEL